MDINKTRMYRIKREKKRDGKARTQQIQMLIEQQLLNYRGVIGDIVCFFFQNHAYEVFIFRFVNRLNDKKTRTYKKKIEANSEHKLVIKMYQITFDIETAASEVNRVYCCGHHIRSNERFYL